MRHRKTFHRSLRRRTITGTALMVIPQPEYEEEEQTATLRELWPYILYTITVFGLIPLFLHVTGIRI